MSSNAKRIPKRHCKKRDSHELLLYAGGKRRIDIDSKLQIVFQNSSGVLAIN